MAEDGTVQAEQGNPDILGESVDQIVSTVTGMLDGTSSGRPEMRDNNAGMVFLGLIRLIPDADSPDPLNREAAQAAIDNWSEEARLRLVVRGRQNGADLIDPTQEDIRAEMIADMRRQLTRINGGHALPESANATIEGLLNNTDEGFVEAIGANSATVRAAEVSYRARVEAARQNGQQVPGFEMVGILADMMRVGEGGTPPNFNGVNLSDVDISPQGQIDMKVSGVFGAMSDFVRMGNGAETALARIQGVSWGDFTGDTFGADRMSYEGLNRIESFGLKDPDHFQRELMAFISPAGLGTVRGGVYNEWSLTPGGETGPVSMDRLFTQPMVDGGLVEFRDQAARDAWNAELGGGLAMRLTSYNLQERMEKFALARSDITMASESAFEAAQGLDAEGVYTPAPEVPEVEDSVTPEATTAAPEADRVADPVSATGAVAYLAGESGVGPLVTATPEATAARLASVPAFLADMRAQRQLDAVPSYSPLAQMQPDMGMGPGQ